VKDTVVYDGIADVIDRLAARHRLGVLSNKPHDLTVVIVERLFPGRFAAVAGGRDGVPLKPDAGAGLAIAAELGVAPAECALVGDSAVDVAAARNAGMRAIGVTWGFRARAELEAAAPDAIVDAPAELLAILI
jgi:phosphoglycolate phosphatase